MTKGMRDGVTRRCSGSGEVRNSGKKCPWLARSCSLLPQTLRDRRSRFFVVKAQSCWWGCEGLMVIYGCRCRCECGCGCGYGYGYGCGCGCRCRCRCGTGVDTRDQQVWSRRVANTSIIERIIWQRDVISHVGCCTAIAKGDNFALWGQGGRQLCCYAGGGRSQWSSSIWAMERRVRLRVVRVVPVTCQMSLLLCKEIVTPQHPGPFILVYFCHQVLHDSLISGGAHELSAQHDDGGGGVGPDGLFVFWQAKFRLTFCA